MATQEYGTTILESTMKYAIRLPQYAGVVLLTNSLLLEWPKWRDCGAGDSALGGS